MMHGRKNIKLIAVLFLAFYSPESPGPKGLSLDGVGVFAVLRRMWSFGTCEARYCFLHIAAYHYMSDAVRFGMSD